MPIKVLVISNYRNYHSVRPEAEIIIGLAGEGFEVHVMTFEDASYIPNFKKAGITVVPFHPEKKFDREESDFIRDYVIQHEIDILQLFNSQATINGLRAAKGLPVKVVLYRGFTGNIRWYDPSAYAKYLHPRVDAIFCNSIGVENLIKSQQLFQKGKAVTINKGHDLSWYEGYEAADIRSELGIPEDALLLVNVANNRRMKGIPYLLKAMTQLPKDGSVHLMLIGANMDTPENLSIIEKGGLKDHVHLPGFRKDVLSIVKASDIFVLPSIFGESITKSVLEAMSLGTTPIISDIPGNVELVVDGENGLVFPSKNVNALKEAILKVYHDRSLLVEMGQKSQERIRTVLSSKTAIQKAKAFYEGLLKD